MPFEIEKRKLVPLLYYMQSIDSMFRVDIINSIHSWGEWDSVVSRFEESRSTTLFHLIFANNRLGLFPILIEMTNPSLLKSRLLSREPMKGLTPLALATIMHSEFAIGLILKLFIGRENELILEGIAEEKRAEYGSKNSPLVLAVPERKFFLGYHLALVEQLGVYYLDHFPRLTLLLIHTCLEQMQIDSLLDVLKALSFDRRNEWIFGKTGGTVEPLLEDEESLLFIMLKRKRVDLFLELHQLLQEKVESYLDSDECFAEKLLAWGEDNQEPVVLRTVLMSLSPEKRKACFDRGQYEKRNIRVRVECGLVDAKKKAMEHSCPENETLVKNYEEMLKVIEELIPELFRGEVNSINGEFKQKKDSNLDARYHMSTPSLGMVGMWVNGTPNLKSKEINERITVESDLQVPVHV